MQKWASQQSSSKIGFTIVELLIVVVVIAVLAAITIVAFAGVTQRAQDSRRQSDIVSIVKALDLYYQENGRFPTSSGSTTINVSWSTSADPSWDNLKAQLVPKYLSSLPIDPANVTGISPLNTTAGRGYAYFTNGASPYCGSTNSPGQFYILTYRLGQAQEDHTDGNCSSNALYYAGLSNWRVIR